MRRTGIAISCVSLLLACASSLAAHHPPIKFVEGGILSRDSCVLSIHDWTATMECPIEGDIARNFGKTDSAKIGTLLATFERLTNDSARDVMDGWFLRLSVGLTERSCANCYREVDSSQSNHPWYKMRRLI